MDVKHINCFLIYILFYAGLHRVVMPYAILGLIKIIISQSMSGIVFND